MKWKREIDELCSKLTEFENKRLLVQITGKNGTSIHYEESINKAEHMVGISEYELCLNFHNNDDYKYKTDPYTLPLNAIKEMEIRFGGVFMQRFDLDESVVHFEQALSYDSENQMKYITLKSKNNNHRLYGPIKSIFGKIGPLRRDQVPSDMSVAELLELIADDRNDLQPLHVNFFELTIHEKCISGVTSFSKKVKERRNSLKRKSVYSTSNKKRCTKPHT